jgi:hypothetical protein
MKRHRLLFLILSLLALTCKKEPPPAVHIPTLALAAVDARCTEAWLKLTTTQLPATVRLVRDGQPVSDLRLLTSDTLVIDEGLLPRRTYTYKAYTLEVRGSGFEVVDSSTQATVTTMDTTSHNFTWQIDTLGDGGGSVLYDVAIINDTLAYAVGEIYKRDSLGNWDPLPYNLVKWNGQRWELKRVSVLYRGSLITPPLNAIFSFSATDIWLSSGVPVHGDGQNWTQYHLFDMGVLTQNDGSINKIWGTPGNMYFVGNRGTIAHYDGVRWRRIESGTGLDVKDVWGTTNPRTAQVEVLALSSTFNTQVQESRVLRITGTTVTPLDNTGLSPSLRGIWFVPGKRYYVVGAGIHQKRMLSDSLWRVYPSGEVTHYHSGGVRGTDINDAFVAGSFREVVHFNGVSWHRYMSLMPGSSGSFGPVAIRGNLIVSVGLVSQYALVAIARR